MTDRDHFAAAALTGLLTRREYDACEFATACEYAYRYADAMLRERGNHSEKPNSSTNHDAVPEARAKSCDDCGPQATPELGNPVLAPPQDGTGNTQEPVAWVIQWAGEDIDVRSVFYDRESAELHVANYHGKNSIIPLYRQPQPTLTDEEREAVEFAICSLKRDDCLNERFAERLAETLERLNERLK